MGQCKDRTVQMNSAKSKMVCDVCIQDVHKVFFVCAMLYTKCLMKEHKKLFLHEEHINSF